jgi:hypothetical protein
MYVEYDDSVPVPYCFAIVTALATLRFPVAICAGVLPYGMI